MSSSARGEVRSPRPRARPQRYAEVAYARAARVLLPIPKPPRADLFRVLDKRRSHRPTRPLSQIQLSTVLWYSAKEFTHRGVLGAADYWEHRAVPSAGGCHPIDLLVRNEDTPSLQLRRYEPRSHSLTAVTIRDRPALKSLQRLLEAVAGPPNAGTTIWLLARASAHSAALCASGKLDLAR